MTRNEFIQRLVIAHYYNSLDLKLREFIQHANELADELEACGVPFDEEPTDEILRKPIQELYEEGKLSVRAFHVLEAAGALHFKDITKLKITDLLRIRTCGRKTLSEIRDLLHEYGYDWAVD